MVNFIYSCAFVLLLIAFGALAVALCIARSVTEEHERKLFEDEDEIN